MSDHAHSETPPEGADVTHALRDADGRMVGSWRMPLEAIALRSELTRAEAQLLETRLRGEQQLAETRALARQQAQAEYLRGMEEGAEQAAAQMAETSFQRGVDWALEHAVPEAMAAGRRSGIREAARLIALIGSPGSPHRNQELEELRQSTEPAG